jgi:methylphosphotriester-DNA--protein-cysteine methyltransferase
MQRYRLLAADGSFRESLVPGQLGGNRRSRIYGRLDCRSAIRALPKGYAKWRVFFADEAAAVAAGYRLCGRCLPAEYRAWKESESS